jgi:RNA-splicing ligase RtcB
MDFVAFVARKFITIRIYFWLVQVRSKAKDLDEAPCAYKDIDLVMKNQKDLVDIVAWLIPLAVITG